MDRIDSLFSERLMKAHLFQGKSNDCGPYSAAIVLKACGKAVDALNLARTMNSWKNGNLLPVIRRIPNWATFPWGIVNIFHENGFSARWRMFSSKFHLEKCLVDNIIPIVITGNYKPLWAHYSILVSISRNGGFGFIDPAAESAMVTWLSDLDFMDRWSKMGKIVIEVSPE